LRGFGASALLVVQHFRDKIRKTLTNAHGCALISVVPATNTLALLAAAPFQAGPEPTWITG
jgi:hypothetical protein